MVFFLRSFVYGSHMFGAGLPEGCVRRFFWETTFRNGFRIQRYLGRQWIHVLVSPRGVLEKITRVIREVGPRIGSTRRGGMI